MFIQMKHICNCINCVQSGTKVERHSKFPLGGKILP